MSIRTIVCTILAITTIAGSVSAQETLVMLEDLPGWQSRTAGGGAAFPFTSSNVALAQEVGAMPSTGQNLGFTLMFVAANTGLPSDFTMSSVGDDSNGWIFEDTGIPNILSPGSISGSQDNDDVNFELGPGGVTAVAIDLCDNNDNSVPANSVMVFDTAGQLIAESPLPLDEHPGVLVCQTIGIVSTVPIGRVMINDEAVGDDIFFSSVYLGDASWCGTIDLAPPFGALDFSDVVAFLSAFGAMDATADLAPPMGAFDFSDVVAFLGAFGAGCP